MPSTCCCTSRSRWRASRPGSPPLLHTTTWASCCSASSSAPSTMSVKKGLATSSTTTAMVRLSPARSWRAGSLRTKPSSWIARSTRARRSGLTRSGRLRTLLTVPSETPASRATSLMLAIRSFRSISRPHRSDRDRGPPGSGRAAAGGSGRGRAAVALSSGVRGRRPGRGGELGRDHLAVPLALDLLQRPALRPRRPDRTDDQREREQPDHDQADRGNALGGEHRREEVAEQADRQPHREEQDALRAGPVRGGEELAGPERVEGLGADAG